MSSCCWRSGSTPGRDGPTDRPGERRTADGAPTRRAITSATVDWSFADRAAPAVGDRRRASPASGSSARTRAPSTRTCTSGRCSPGAGSRRTSTRTRRPCTSSKASCSSRSADAVHRLVTGDYALFPDRRPTRARQHERRRRPLALAQLAGQAAAADAGRQDTFFEPAQDLARMDAAAVRPPFGDPTLRLVGHYDGHPAAARGPRHQGRRPWSRPRRDGHRADRLQRDLGPDARRPGLRRGSRDDVHRRLRARRRRPAARPPVRGGVLLPRGRDRGRARRPALHAARGRRRVLERRLGPRLLQHRHRAGPMDRDPGATTAGPARPIAGWRAGNDTRRPARRGRRSRMADRGAVVDRRRHAGDRARGRAALRGRGRDRRLQRTRPCQRRRPRSRLSAVVRPASRSTCRSPMGSPRRSPASARSVDWSSRPSTATTTPWPSTTSAGPSAW